MTRLVLLVTLLPACARPDHPSQSDHGAGPHWTYAGASGPEHWGGLDTAFAACSAGRRQSPVDLAAVVDTDLPTLELDHAVGASEVRHHGHTIQIAVPPGNALRLGSERFDLRQFHFHAPSEHHVAGRSFPLEAHFVHADSSGALAVVAVLFEDGPANAALGRLWAHLPDHAGEARPLATPLAPGALLPQGRDYYRLDGSLTTPPCTEGVRWLVLKQPLSASAEQVAALTQRIGHANNRPLQPINDRPVYQ